MKDFEDLVRTVVTLCSPEEQERLREMEDWIVKNEVKHQKKNKKQSPSPKTKPLTVTTPKLQSQNRQAIATHNLKKLIKQ